MRKRISPKPCKNEALCFPQKLSTVQERDTQAGIRQTAESFIQTRPVLSGQRFCAPARVLFLFAVFLFFKIKKI